MNLLWWRVHNEPEVAKPNAWRCPVRVLGCLRNGELEITLSSYFGWDGSRDVPIQTHLVPFDLRMPNSEFDILVSCNSIVCVLRKDEENPDGWTTQAA